MLIFRKSTNTNAFGARSYTAADATGAVYEWCMIHNAAIGTEFDPVSPRVEVVGLRDTRVRIALPSVRQMVADALGKPFANVPPTPVKRTTRRSYGQPWRNLLIEALIDNGGYGGHGYGRSEGSPVSYNVSLDYVTTDYDEVRASMLTEFPETAGYPLYPRDEWDDAAQDRCRWAEEDARRQLDDGDMVTYRMMSPAVAAHYGLSDGDTYDVEFALEGRSGKHLCIKQFEGQDLSGIDLVEALRDQTADKNQAPYNAYTNQWCRRLLAMMDEWDTCFTPRTASDEVNRELAFQMMLRHDELNNETIIAAKEAALVQEWAERDVRTVAQ